MTFDDYDMEHFRKIVEENHSIREYKFYLLALLARLEAAEKVCEQMSNWSNLAEDDREILEAWRKAAGK
jgi:hypothetical protein